MFPFHEHEGGRDEEREEHPLALVLGRGGGGGGADGDEDGARQPGCMGFLVGWRRRRSRISATTGDLSVKDLPPQELSVEMPGQRQVRMELPPHEVDAETHREQQVVAENSREQRVRTDATEEIKGQLTELPAEVDCLIVAKLNSLSDRCALQGVSNRWRSATQQCTSPPQPLIANADFTVSNCFVDGLMCVPLQMNTDVPRPPDHEVTCLGSLNSWMVIAFDEWKPHENLALPHNYCYLVQPMKGINFSLPSPCSFEIEAASGSLQITGGDGSFSFYKPVKTCSLRLKKIVISQSKSPADSKLVGLATQRGSQHIVFSAPDMSCWYICSANFITVGSDVEFLQDKVIILGSNQEELFQIDFGPGMSFFPVLCEIRKCMVLELPQLENTERQLNLVSSAGELLIIARYFTLNWEQLTAVRVFMVNSVSWTWREIESLGDHCILVSLSCSRAITSSGDRDPKADHIYFLDQFCPNFFPGEDDNFSYRSQVYNMRDATVNELLIGRGRGTRRPGFPMWFFPSE